MNGVQEVKRNVGDLRVTLVVQMLMTEGSRQNVILFLRTVLSSNHNWLNDLCLVASAIK